MVTFFLKNVIFFSPLLASCIVCDWTDWIDVSNPNNDGGDYETYENIRKNGIDICLLPLDISCQAKLFPGTPIKDLEQTLICDVSTGLICNNTDQAEGQGGVAPQCLNYEIRVYCCSNVCSTTTVVSTTTPTPSTKNTTSTTTSTTTTTSKTTTIITIPCTTEEPETWTPGKYSFTEEYISF